MDFPDEGIEVPQKEDPFSADVYDLGVLIRDLVTVSVAGSARFAYS